MANEAQLYTYTTINHVAATPGTVAASGGFSTTGDISTDVSNTTNLAPLCNVIFTATFGSNPTAGATIDFYRRDLNIASTNDSNIPTSGYLHEYVGSAEVIAATTQYFQLTGIPLPPTSCQFFVQNNTDQALSTSWRIDVQPYTFKPAT